MALVALPALAIAPTVELADTPFSTDRTAANVSADGARPVWSRVDSNGNARLVKRVHGGNVDARVAPKGALFDPDVGSDGRGRRVVVYTRCAGLSGRNCDVWIHRRGSERRLRGASSTRCSEFAPSVWRGRFVFARSGPGACNGLYFMRRGRHGRRPPVRLDRRIAADTDVRHGQVVYQYSPAGDPGRNFIRAARVGRRSRLVIAGVLGEGERTRVSSPVLDNGYLYWLHDDRRRKEIRVGRKRLTARRAPLEFSDRTLPGRVDSLSVSRGLVFYTNGRGLFAAVGPAPIFRVGD